MLAATSTLETPTAKAQQILCLVFRHNVNVNSIRIKARLLAAVLVDQATCTDNSIAVIRIEEPNTRDFFLLIALFAAAVAQQAFVFHPSQYFWLMRPPPLSPLSLMIFSLYMCTCVYEYMCTCVYEYDDPGLLMM